jgi:hypothetical protein
LYFFTSPSTKGKEREKGGGGGGADSVNSGESVVWEEILLKKERKKRKKERKKRKKRKRRKKKINKYFAQIFLIFAIDHIGLEWVRKVVIEDLTLRKVMRFKPNLVGIK